jgi:predicted transcriptional regulator
MGAGAEKPTHIMYKANLSWKVLHLYIKSLEAKGFIIASSNQKNRLYHVSSKGFLILKEFSSINDDLNLQDEIST